MLPTLPKACAALLSIALSFGVALADGPADNQADQVRPVPPPGIEVPPEKIEALNQGLRALDETIQQIRADKSVTPESLAYLPDVEICHKAVRDALRHHEFFKPGEIDFAILLLELGRERAESLRKNQTPWTRQTGFVFRGYRSRIDGSVQPYGLEIPTTYDFESPAASRLDFWFHGRGETLSEVAFLQQRHTGRGGKIKPDNAIVLHPYGRYSNANKFAGEEDLFEALGAAQQDYRIDEDRIFVRGFSMGGAACWQFAVHYADRWAGAQPGAGFSETPDFLKTFQGETLNPTWWEEKLWRWYDATHWVINLTNTSTIAYSGEIDRQKQAADQMVTAAEKEGLELLHLIGPDTAHKLHPETLEEIESRLTSISNQGRRRVPPAVRFVTFTLRYNRMHWVQVDALTEHWEEGRVEAFLQSNSKVAIETKGIEAFSLHFESGTCPLDLLKSPEVELDGQLLEAPRVISDRSWKVYFRKVEGAWKASASPISTDHPLSKTHRLQGPIDDAFTDSFVMVSPDAEGANPSVSQWTKTEQAHAIAHWRKQFRGDARVKNAKDISDEDILQHHLVLWGTPDSNSMIGKLISDLPVNWTNEKITIGAQSFNAAHHTLAFIYPNPRNPERYVVLNSGFTYREYDYLNNARQTSKLPDWAVIDLREPPSSRYPGKIVAAGFFDENWQIKKNPAK
ncbi:MAG: prolyl oligopeptidase family serine peptidase [Verrucomicrobiales bacterium]|nr:prolyl oligopeptidase family serine peptidase [Verrucomicrobiales bacterium]